MTRMIVPEFAKFHKEGELIGRLVVGYSALESALTNCVSMIRDDLNMVVKAMFRARGETQRIDIADAMGRTEYAAIGLGDMFSEAVADMRFCLKIRNQYAHGQWHDDWSSKLCFIDMEEIAKEHAVIEDFRNLTFHYLDTSLLQSQEEYFLYNASCFLYLNFEARKLAGKIPTHALTKPKKVARPQCWLQS